MATKVREVSAVDLASRRAEILEDVGLTDEEMAAKVASGGLAGREWAAWSEIEDIDYLLERD